MKRLLLLSALWALIVCSMYAQDRVISGKIISSEDNSPLPGVNVLAKGTTTGVVSDSEGKYKLNVPEGATKLVFSFVGFLTQEVEIGGRTTIDVVLTPDTKQLSEVVVTAQGIVREKRALGYAVATVNQNAIADRPLADVGRVLQGKIAGVNITQTSGVSGTGTNITIRGYSSITGSVQPLFVVDGVPFNSATNSRGSFVEGGQAAPSRFLDIDPNNIENVSVLKGLAAAVLYGDQGRNGVILITTKNASAKNKPAEITLTQSVFGNTAVLPVYQNTYIGGFQQNSGYFFSNWGPSVDEYLRRQELGLAIGAFPSHPYAVLQDAGLRAAFADFVANNPYPIQAFPNNVRDFFRTGIVSNTSLNLNGGNGTTSYNVSVGYNREQGYIPNNDLARLSLGLGARTQVIKGVTINTSFNFINTDVKTPPLNAGLGNNTLNGFPSVLANVMYTPRNIDLMGLPFESPVDNRSVYFRSSNDIPNPRWILKYYSTPSITNRFFTSNSVIVDLAENLSVTYRVGLDTYNERQEAKFNKGGVDFVRGAYFTRDIVNTIWNHDIIMSYSKQLNDKLTLAGKLGANMRNDRYDEQSVRSVDQLAFGLMRHNNFIETNASSFTQEQTRMGVYGEVTADYKNFLYANFAARNDWTSTVEIENRRIFYPSGSVSFIPTTAFEGLQSSMLNELKIRAGVGTSAGFPTPYSTRNILNQNSRAFLDASGNVSQTHTVDNFLGNPNLKPELITEYELGVESKLFNNKIGVDLTWYRRETTNLITNTPIDPATGYTSTAINIGKIRNTGVELAVNATPIRKDDFSWETVLNFSRNVPITVELGGQLTEVVVAGFPNLGNFAVPGRPFNIIKGNAFLRDERGNRIVGGNGLYLSDPTIRELGNPNPAFNTSWINTLNYKGLSFNLMLEYRHGGALYSSTAGALLGRGLTKDTEFDRSLTFILPGVKQDGSPNDIQITAADYHFNSIYFLGGDEGRIFDGSTIRIREASLSYNLPKNLVSKTPFKGVSVSLQGNNIWYRAINIPKYLRLDTDNLGLGVGNGLGFEFLTGPASRRFGGTLRLNF